MRTLFFIYFLQNVHIKIKDIKRFNKNFMFTNFVQETRVFK